MIDPELDKKLEEIRALAQQAAVAAEKSRKYLWWTGVITIVLFVLPLIGLAIVAPQFLSSYTAQLQGIGY